MQVGGERSDNQPAQAFEELMQNGLKKLALQYIAKYNKEIIIVYIIYKNNHYDNITTIRTTSDSRKI